MPGEGQFLLRGEDAQAVVGLKPRRAQQEGRLAEVRPVGEALHLLRRKSVGADHDAERVALEGDGGEDVDLAVGEDRHQAVPSRLPVSLSKMCQAPS